MDTDSRSRLYHRLSEVLGPEHAVTLMEYLPPTEGSRLATRADLKADITEVRREVAELRKEFKADVAELRRSMDDGFHSLHMALHEQARTFTIAMIGSATAVAGLAFGAATLI